jgi:hypothetical protein
MTLADLYMPIPAGVGGKRVMPLGEWGLPTHIERDLRKRERWLRYNANHRAERAAAQRAYKRATQRPKIRDTARGERVARAKLTARQVVEIRRLKAAGEMHIAIASKYGVDASLIGRIVNRKVWTHV